MRERHQPAGRDPHRDYEDKAVVEAVGLTAHHELGEAEQISITEK